MEVEDEEAAFRGQTLSACAGFVEMEGRRQRRDVMGLTTKLATHFAQNIQRVGIFLRNTRKVRVVSTTPFVVQGFIEPFNGPRNEVELVRDRQAVRVRCTCSRYEDRRENCEHIWAALLETEAKGYLGGHGSDPLFVVPHDTEAREYPGHPGRLGLQPITPEWERFLNRFRQPTPAPEPSSPLAPGAEIIYILDGTRAEDGVLFFEVQSRRPLQSGGWSKPANARVPRDQIQRLPDPLDRHVLAALAGGANDNYAYGYYEYQTNVPNRYRLHHPLREVILAQVGPSGRCFLRSPKTTDLQPLTWDEGPPWELALEVVPEGGKAYRLSGGLRRPEERLPLSEAVLLLPGGPIVWRDRLGRFDDHGAFDWVDALKRQESLKVPAEHAERLVAGLLELPHLPRLELPETLRYQEVHEAPRPRLVVRPEKGRSYGPRQSRLVGDLSFLYDGVEVASGHPGQVVVQTARKRLIRRDPASEQQAEAELARVGFKIVEMYNSPPERELSARNLPRVVRELLGKGWLVEAEGKLYRKAGAFKMEVTSGIDWFELHGSVDFDGQRVSLPQLLAALRRGDNMVRLDDGTFGLLPEEWLKKFAPLAGVGSEQQDHLRFRRTQTGLLDALLSSQPEATCDEVFARAREELRSFAGVEPADPAAGFQGRLREYQREGLGWLHFLHRFGFGGCLADDMGLGKTVQVLALLEARREKRPAASLVVMPRSLVFNWKAEAARFTPQLRVLDHTGIERAKTVEPFDDHDVVLTTYGTLRRDVSFLKDYRFDYCILDEAQAIKNASSDSAKAARLVQSEHRLAMSGTPVENHLGELWSLFEFLNPGMLGTATIFQTGAGRNPDPETRALLARGLRPFILRRTKEQVARDLPEKTEQTVYCELEGEQRRHYDQLRDFYRGQLLGGTSNAGTGKYRMQVLEALLRLRQAACHPGLIDRDQKSKPSAKLDALLPQLEELFEEEHKVLVFSQFTQLLSIVRDRLDAEGVPYEYLDGRTRDRAARVERFQNDPECKLFLISLKAGGLGLNLTAAEYVFLLDPWWNPAVEAQAIDRAHRIGQSKPVFAYRLIAKNTVEEKVLELQKTKRALADAILSADNNLIRDLSREDLEMLLS
jgi:superfamily II DNA or RNA helicase